MKMFPTVEPHFQRRHVPEREARGGGWAISALRGAETDGFDRDRTQADSGADDPAPYAALHKSRAGAEGNDRSKQGVIANTSNQL